MEKNLKIPIDNDVRSRLAEFISKRELVLFCGAGISSSVVPTARKFLSDQGIQSLSWQQGTQLIEKKSNFKTEFKKTFTRKEPTELHMWLAHLNARYYITTNYDQMLETALTKYYQGQAEKVSIVMEDADLANIQGRNTTCVKLHGDVNNHSLLVMTGRDYRRRIRYPVRVDYFVSSLFASHPVLFIGYSLDDDNVVALLEGVESSVDTPKYFLQVSPDREKKKYLEYLGLEVITLDDDSRVCHFLSQLWEYAETLSDFLVRPEPSPSPIDELLLKAVTDRNSGRLEEAEKSYDVLMKRNRELGEDLRLVPRFLWLTVSLKDKREEWGKLDELNKMVVEPLLESVRNRSPKYVFDTLLACYGVALSLAYIRAMNFDEALNQIRKIDTWKPHDGAADDYFVLRANILTTSALANYCLYIIRMENYQISSQLLDDAVSDLDKAEMLYKNYGGMGEQNESEHLGRYFGLRAFVYLAKNYKKNILEEDKIRILEYAEKSHSGNRTRFGKIAGYYCNSFVCRYFGNHYKEEIFYAESQRLIKEVENEEFKLPLIVEYKFNLLSLISNFENETLTEKFSIPPHIAGRFLELGIKEKQWLWLPVN